MKLILASASPRRAEILAAAGIPFETHPTNIDELRRAGESTVQLVERLARTKAETAARAMRSAEPAIILGADTVVVLGDEVLGKPLDAANAREMLMKLRGREHQVITGFAAMHVSDGAIRLGHETTRVWLMPMSDADVDDYVATGEPLDKAGAYAIQGVAGKFIPKIEGDYFNVVGLPLARVWQALTELGWPASK
jgi:septum formation protein